MQPHDRVRTETEPEPETLDCRKSPGSRNQTRARTDNAQVKGAGASSVVGTLR
jgi:hypothetical protein